jgi:hypothetical protein
LCLAHLVCAEPLAAAAQEPASPPVSLERIRKAVEKEPARKLEIQVPSPQDERAVPKFKTSVDQRVYMLPFLEYLRKEFELTPLQRQSQEWRSKCCGINLLQLPKIVKKELKREEEANARQQVARELAELEAKRKK